LRPLLSQSHTTLHGRPFPLNGSHFANIFVHYEPLDHAEMNRAAAAHMNIPSGVRRSDYDAEEEEEEEDPEEVRRDVEFRALHLAAAKNDYGTVKRLLEHDLSLVRRKDNNGWEPLHEAARSGHTGMVKFLVDHGADIGSLTNHGESALWWAKRTLSPGHSTISYLEGIGAPEAGEL
jgi:prolyl 4-hydroxylase